MNDDVYYDQVAQELQAKTMVPGVWAKAFAEANGQIDRARALYIKHRVVQLAHEANEKLRSEQRAAHEATKQRAVSQFRRSAYKILSFVFGLLSFVGGLGFAASCFALSLPPPPEHGPAIVVAVFFLIVALLFGFYTYKLRKAAKR